MVLFKEKHCVHCGKKTNALFRYKIQDNQYICSECISKIPGVILAKIHTNNYDQFQRLYEYINIENKRLDSIFTQTHSYKGIHLDIAHGLYYLDYITPRVYMSLEELGEFRLEFIADEVKEGFLKDTVTGKVYLKIESYFPEFTFEKVIAEKVKSNAKIKDGIFKKKVSYMPPSDMDTFRNIFAFALENTKEALFNRLNQELVEENYCGIFSDGNH